MERVLKELARGLADKEKQARVAAEHAHEAKMRKMEADMAARRDPRFHPVLRRAGARVRGVREHRKVDDMRKANEPESMSAVQAAGRLGISLRHLVMLATTATLVPTLSGGLTVESVERYAYDRERALEGAR